MSFLQEQYRIELPADLARSSEAVGAVLAWLQVQGYRPEAIKPWRLPIAEAVTNAIVHGCRARPGARVGIAARVTAEGTEVRVSDPGHYEPGPEAAQLGDDLLAESGRGGFLIAQGTDRFAHHNDAGGHTLALHWHQPPVRRASVVAAASADQALDDLAAQLGDAFEAITAYAEFASLLATTSDFDEVLAQVRRKLAQTIEHEALVLRFLQGDSLVLAAPAGRFPHSIPLASPGYEARVGAARNCAALASPADLAAGDPLAAASGPLVIVAIGCPKRSRGTLTLVRSAGAPAFTAGQIAFVQSVADFLGAAQSLAESRQQREEQIRLEQELQLAARIQHQLLPQSPPSVAGWTVAGACQPSRAMGGDYFDWIVRDDGSCLVLVADVMGKGMPAAMVATMLRSTWRTIARRGIDPGQLFTELNTHLVRDLATLEVFITAVLVHVTPGSGRVRYANAGHCALLQCSGPDADCRPHACGGPPLGINAETRFAPAELVLAPGDSLFAFTDGCYELDRRSGSAAGLRLLEGELRTSSGLAPADLVPALLRKLQARVAGELPDDCTLVAMRFNQ